MLCLMFESSRRGYLQKANGQPLSQVHIARMTGCTADEAAHLMQELDDAGVFSRTEHGVIYSRRITRDEHISTVRREAGKKGALAKARDDAGHFAPANPPANLQQDGQQKPRSSSSSSSSSSKESSGKPEVDSRHTPFRKLIANSFEAHSNGLECPWSGSEASSLSAFLQANPKLTEEGMSRLLKNREESGGVMFTDRPRVWIGGLTRFAGGPVDQWKLKQNGTPVAKKIPTFTREQAAAR
jgi:hypothetical protein